MSYAAWRPIITRVNATERRIEVLGGGVCEFWTLEDANAGRSRKYRRVAVDEGGLVPGLLDIWTEAIRPTLADLEGDAAIGGTPKGRNAFWTMYQWGLDDGRSDWKSWQLPTSANPYIKPSEIAAMRDDLSERSYRQEIEAAFLEGTGEVFRFIREAVTSRVSTIEPPLYVAGIDWGREHDYTVIIVMDARSKAVVHCDRWTGIPYAQQIGRILPVFERYPPEIVVAEQNSMGGPIVERLFYEHGLPVRPFTTTYQSKAKIIDALALAFERRAIGIPDLPWLIGELEAYSVRKTSGTGLPTYGAPDGFHDDGVIALALGWQGVLWANGGEL